LRLHNLIPFVPKFNGCRTKRFDCFSFKQTRLSIVLLQPNITFLMALNETLRAVGGPKMAGFRYFWIGIKIASEVSL
jgi:hypothetical protein